MKRGTGTTSRQMIKAPHGAIFVWCNGNVWYPCTLANHLGRQDLQIKPLGWLREDNMRASTGEIVVDHAAHLSEEAWVALHCWEARRNG